MSFVAAALSFAAFAAGGETTMTGRVAPDIMASEWPVGPEVHLRNVRGRRAVVLFYHTAC